VELVNFDRSVWLDHSRSRSLVAARSQPPVFPGLLVQWYRSGQDPERRLPLLSTYLGHVHVADTQWYLEGFPELMREAMERLPRESSHHQFLSRHLPSVPEVYPAAIT
jgi:hypothetical protein